jgi:hypothetical protein
MQSAWTRDPMIPTFTFDMLGLCGLADGSLARQRQRQRQRHIATVPFRLVLLPFR